MALSPKARLRKLVPPAAESPSLFSLLSLLEGVPALLWETDSELRLRFLTGATLRTAGISRTDCEGAGIDKLFPSSPLAPRARRAHEKALAGRSASFEIELNGRDLHADVKPVYDAAGAIRGVIGIALDMTERRVAERALRLSEHGYRSLIEDSPYAICRATLSGELLQVNRAMADMLGYDSQAAGELLLRDLPLIFSPSHGFEEFRKALTEAASKKEPSPSGRDAVWLRRDGRPIQVRLSGRVVRSASGEISHLDFFADDVTEKKHLEAELVQAQKMHAIGQLAGGVAHDFNNLLTVIVGHIGMMLSDPREIESKESLEAVQSAAERAAALTKQLLAFSRRQMMRSQTMNLNEVIQNLMGMLTRLIKENIRLEFHPGDNLGSVKADPNEIERVLLNLVVNAQDAMPGGGLLTIETANVHTDPHQPEESGGRDFVRITVRDTGVGMDPDTQARVFDPFFTTKEPSEGTGLGLSVVYGVVRQSGGFIRLESEPGVGTAFRVFLPRVAVLQPASRVPARSGNLPRGSETILFAEDDAAIRKLVTHSLEGLGYRVLAVPDGVAALATAQQWPDIIHLLLSDFIMPSLGGRELASRLRTIDPALKVVFISGYAGHSVTERELQLGDVCFLQKPFSLDVLARTVREVLDGTN
jgi:PAS domain S-box-containing protein